MKMNQTDRQKLKMDMTTALVYAVQTTEQLRKHMDRAEAEGPVICNLLGRIIGDAETVEGKIDDLVTILGAARDVVDEAWKDHLAENSCKVQRDEIMARNT